MKENKPKKAAKAPAKSSQTADADAPAQKPAAPKKPAKEKPPLTVPAILLEGDSPSAPVPSGPGQRYALGRTTPMEEPRSVGEPGELPDAYGTERLLLTARDPHWLYAHWDLNQEQLKKYNALSVDRHLVLRVYRGALAGKPLSETHVHPESRNWFVNVDEGGAKYFAELGYYKKNGQWATISTSAATLTPPDTLSEDLSVWFETLPADLRFEELVQLVKAAVAENIPLMEAINQLRAAGVKGLPSAHAVSAQRWTPAQERALAELVTMDSLRRVWMGSLEITELIRRQLQQALSSAAAAQFSLPSAWSGEVSSLSSPYGGKERRKGFWFNVNAELIIYGATEPDAEVTIGGRVIKLRPDGTFSYRFALPDGRYELPAVATSADATDTRSAELKFSRDTRYAGDVGKHPQDARLKPPLAAHVA